MHTMLISFINRAVRLDVLHVMPNLGCTQCRHVQHRSVSLDIFACIQNQIKRKVQ